MSSVSFTNPGILDYVVDLIEASGLQLLVNLLLALRCLCSLLFPLELVITLLTSLLISASEMPRLIYNLIHNSLDIGVIDAANLTAILAWRKHLTLNVLKRKRRNNNPDRSFWLRSTAKKSTLIQTMNCPMMWLASLRIILMSKLINVLYELFCFCFARRGEDTLRLFHGLALEKSCPLLSVKTVGSLFAHRVDIEELNLWASSFSSIAHIYP